MPQYIIRKGILFYDGVKFQPRLKKAKKYYSVNNALRIKKHILRKGKQNGIKIYPLKVYIKSIKHIIDKHKEKEKITCQRKKHFSNKKEAITAKNLFKKKVNKNGEDNTLVVYKCTYCSKYHIGNINGFGLYYSQLIQDLKTMNLL